MSECFFSETRCTQLSFYHLATREHDRPCSWIVKVT